MKWRDVNNTHHDMQATVREPQTPGLSTSMVVTGTIKCDGVGSIPVLHSNEENSVYSFMPWYVVELI